MASSTAHVPYLRWEAPDLEAAFLEYVTTIEELREERRRKPPVRDVLEGYSDEEVFAVIEARRSGGRAPMKPVKQAEFETYTGSSDAEGTLGGLVETGRRVALYLSAALERGQLCSNDPVCVQHAPDDVHERRFLHGAACHGCLLIAETSCEQHNDFLDRALVVSTVARAGSEFFG